MFTVSHRNAALTIQKFNSISNVWEHFARINVKNKLHDMSFDIVWDEHFIFMIGGFSYKMIAFVRTVS